MATTALSSSSSSHPWQLISKPHTNFTLSSFSNSFISLSSFSSSCSSSSKNSNASKNFVYICKYSANDNREKAIVVSKPIKSHEFGALFQKRSLWRRIFFTSKKVRAIILLNVITVIYASDIPVLKEVEEFMDPATFNVFRFTLSAVPFLPAAFQARHDAHVCKSGAELGLWASLGYLFQSLGLLTSDAGRASFISILTIIVVPLLDGMFGSVIPPLTWFGAIMSVVGVAMLESTGSPPDVGDLFNILSAVFFGINMLRTERISRCTSKENFIPLLGYEMAAMRDVSATETAIIYGTEPVWGAGFAWFLLGERWDTIGWLGAALILGGSLVVHMFGSLSSTDSGSVSSITWFLFEGWFGESHRPWTWELFWASWVSFPWIPAIYTGVFSRICLWVEMAAVQEVSATEAAIIYGLEPIWGAGFAWFLLGERWGIYGWIGAALVLGGSLIAQMFGSLSSTDSGDSEQ
uniref:EamA domain-containing protein n=1 Tax=Chenopodium quinoa TaxID=63459 RepID=A0A803N2W1_CHEQI